MTSTAPILVRPDWANINLTKGLTVAVLPGATAPTIQATISASALQGDIPFATDANGNPIGQLATAGPGVPGIVNPFQMLTNPLDLTEVITRADGTTVTAQQLLDAIATPGYTHPSAKASA